MIKEDVISYLKILGLLLMMSLPIYGSISTDGGSDSPLLITSIIISFLMGLGILLYNYLQYGLFWFWVSKEHRRYLKQKYGKWC